MFLNNNQNIITLCETFIKCKLDSQHSTHEQMNYSLIYIKNYYNYYNSMMAIIGDLTWRVYSQYSTY